ncbi:uncharacterized protein LOC118736086 [Rhagoletis pomonella]|uniref:uncharacterized protein LOC118736086 n=1 Tax=Rhagoletis pomonella TaxID=28610 RepID=UPI00177C856E|nr:uncharacterized protein LOC118736086 [Rhagoletis pomonella]
MYASKSLPSAQRGKEALALVWAVGRFHNYLFGREFELISDHKPLETIFGPRSIPCARIERWFLRLQSYKYKIIYKSGKSNIADPLSWLLNASPEAVAFDEYAEHYVNWIIANAVPKALKIKEIEEESTKDTVIRAVKEAIGSNKWDDEGITGFKAFAVELCFSGNILLRGTKIVIPEKLRTRILELAHEGHPGMSKMKKRLRSKQNGEVERQNGSILKSLVISQNTKGDWRIELQKYLLAYRSTPHMTTGVSPAKMMFGHEIRDKLPSIQQPIEDDNEIDCGIINLDSSKGPGTHWVAF